MDEGFDSKKKTTPNGVVFFLAEDEGFELNWVPVTLYYFDPFRAISYHFSNFIYHLVPPCTTPCYGLKGKCKGKFRLYCRIAGT